MRLQLISPRRPFAGPIRDVRTWFGLYEAAVPVLGIVVCGLIAAGLASRSITVPWADQVPVPVRLVVPAVAGSLAGAALGNRVHQLTRTAPRRTARWRAAWLAVLTALTLLAWTPMFVIVADSFGAGAVARNLIGFLGLGFATATLLRASLAWFGPLPFAIVSMFGMYRADDGTVWAQWWAWPMADQRTFASWIAAIALFAAGTALFVRRDGRP